MRLSSIIIRQTRGEHKVEKRFAKTNSHIYCEFKKPQIEKIMTTHDNRKTLIPEVDLRAHVF